jgi:hypothetical protein
MLADADNDLDADDVTLFCSSCADKMRKDGTTIKASLIMEALAATQ